MDEKHGRRETKKARILERWRAGERDMWEIARGLGSKPSYVASVLQEAGEIRGYSDLYTSPDVPENIYAGFIRGRLGFKSRDAAERGVELLERTYLELERMGDRAGQHHCLVAALTMFHRALYIGKTTEAEPYRRWLLRRLGMGEGEKRAA